MSSATSHMCRFATSLDDLASPATRCPPGASVPMRTSIASIVLVFGFTACSSGGGLDPGAGNDPGTRTGTLIVGGSVVATPLHANARTAREFTSELRVVVQAGGGLASTGTVTVTSASGTVALTFSDDGHLGYWM